MRIIMMIVLTAALVTSFTALSADDGWYILAESKDGNNEYSVKLGSGNSGQNKQGEPITVLVGKVAGKKENKVTIYKWYVTDADCTNEYGQLTVLGIDGTYKFDSAFAKGSGSIASSIAEFICDAAAFKNKQRDEKGI